MGAITHQLQNPDHLRLLGLTVHGCEVGHAAAQAAAASLAGDSASALQIVRRREEELDNLQREINEGVGAIIARVAPEEARELLACVRFIADLERVGDLLLGFANRMHSVGARLHQHDIRNLSTMAGLLVRMLADVQQAFRQRDAKLALSVLRADSEMDRYRNLIFIRHIENREKQPRQESFHVVFMTQFLERAGDHARNIGEGIVHLVTGRSARHLLRTQDKPFENLFVDFLRQREVHRRR